MYFESLISVKCCPKLHIKQLRNNLHYFCLGDRVGWGGGSQMKRGVQEKGGGQDPLTTPPLDTPMSILTCIMCTHDNTKHNFIHTSFT